MKNFKNGTLLMMIAMLLFSSSCEKDESPDTLSFSMTSETYEVSDLGGIVHLPVTANVDWEMVANETDWIKASKKSNEMVEVKLTPNVTDQQRETTLAIKQTNGSLSAQIKVVQYKLSTPRIEVLKENEIIAYLSLNGEAKTTPITINSNTNWRLSTIDSWVKTNVTSGKAGATIVEVTVTENSEKPRNGFLKIAVEGGVAVDFKIAQNSTTADFDSPTHYFYVTFGTMPTLYAGLHALSHDKPSFFAYERQNTFDPEMFPPHVTLAVANGPNEVQTVMRDYMKKKILEIRDREPNAIFGLYVDDLRCRIGYDWFVKQGIDSSRVKVTLLSDGTGTYVNFNNVDNQDWANLKADVEALDWNSPTNNKGTRALPEFESWDWCFYMATLPNYRILMQDFSLLEPSSEEMRTNMNNMNVVSTTPFEMLGNLSKERQATFYKMANFKKEAYAAMFDRSPKKNLVIIGTNGDDNQRAYVEKIYNSYSGEYDIFFKPHPSDKTSADYETAFVGLTLLPGQMPFEIFVWSLIDKIDLIGGFQSTVYLTVPINKVGFIFGMTSSVGMIKPLNILFKDAKIDWVTI